MLGDSGPGTLEECSCVVRNYHDLGVAEGVDERRDDEQLVKERRERWNEGKRGATG